MSYRFQLEILIEAKFNECMVFVWHIGYSVHWSYISKDTGVSGIAYVFGRFESALLVIHDYINFFEPK